MQAELTLLASFIVGLSSTLHCLGMCSGISTVLFLQNTKPENNLRVYKNALVYNFGRLFSYTAIGLLAGVASQFVSQAFLLQGHFFLQVCSSIILILIALNIIGVFSISLILEKLAIFIWQPIKNLMKSFIPAKSPVEIFCLGLVWGWLPCGLVYSVLLLAVSSGNAIQSGLCMLAFGLGTLPGMLMTSVGSNIIKRGMQKPVFKYISAFLIIIIALIPFKTAFIDHDQHAHHSHHHH